MNCLVIGDVHAQVSNLEDTSLLFDLIEQEIVKREISKVVFLGDMFHTHAVIRQEVAHFYQERFRRILRLKAPLIPGSVIIVVGNHDGISPTDISRNACQLTLGHLVNVVTEPQSDESFVYIPFMHDNDKFLEVANGLYQEGKILVCHQTFKGAAYETGMPVPEGVDPRFLLFDKTICGHIHKSQTISNKVVYLGTPRAVTAGEANDPKFIFHLTDTSCEGIPTGHLVKEYKIFEYDESGGTQDLSTLQFKTKDDVRIVVSGSETFYESFLAMNKSMIGRVKFIPKIKKELGKQITIDENEANLEAALKKYVYEVVDIDTNKKDQLWEIIQRAVQ